MSEEERPSPSLKSKKSIDVDDMRRAKKASCRGKMSHVTKIINRLSALILENVGRREVEALMNLLRDAIQGYKVYHDEYILTLTDEAEMDLALNKLVELEEKAIICLSQAEEYIERFEKSCHASSRSSNPSRDKKYLASKGSSNRSKINTGSKKTDSVTKKIDDLKERLKYEEKLRQVKVHALKREIEIRGEMQRRKAERDSDGSNITRSSGERDVVKEEYSTVEGESFKEEKVVTMVDRSLSKLLPVNNVNNANQAISLPGVSTQRTPVGLSLPFVLNENKIPLNVFDGKKENWPRFIQTFKALVDKQPYDTVVKLAVLEQHLRGTARDCIKGFPFGERSYELILKTLEERFGDEEDQAAFHFGAIDNLPKIRKSDVIGLRKFYDDLKAHVQVWKA